MMDIADYILPLLTFAVFFIPKNWMRFYTLAVVSAVSFRVVAGILNALFSTVIPFSIEFSPLAAVFAISVVIVGMAVSVYSCGYLKEYLSKSHAETAFHSLCFMMLFQSMAGVLSAETKQSFLFFWELMSLTSFALVLLNGEGNKKAVHAAVGYLILMHLGFFLLFFGFYLVPDNHGLMGYGNMPFSVWILFFMGFGIKVGMFPVHGWLPVTHPAAPSHVSAMMSAAMLNIGIYGIFMATVSASDLLTTGIVLLSVGAVTALYGGYRSALESNLKTLLAYSSMDNMGIILLGIGIGAIGKATGSSVLAFSGYCGALIHMLCHSAFKSSLFMCAGSVHQSSGTFDLDLMGGLLKKMPTTGLFFLLAALSAMAIPPFSGFAGEFVILGGIFSAFKNSHDILLALAGLVVLSVVAGFTLVAMTKAYSRSMLSTPRSALKRTPREANPWMNAGIFISVFFVITGMYVFSKTVLTRSSVICAVTDSETISMFRDSSMTIFVLGAVLMLLAALLVNLRKLISHGVRKEETWKCGTTDNGSMCQYGASSFSAGMSDEIMRDSQVEVSPEQESGLFRRPDVRSIRYRDRISRTITRLLSGIMHLMVTSFARVQTGKVYHYILQTLLFMAAVALLSLFGM